MKFATLGILGLLMLASCQHSQSTCAAIPDHPVYEPNFYKAASPELAKSGTHVQEFVTGAVKYYKAVDAACGL